MSRGATLCFETTMYFRKGEKNRTALTLEGCVLEHPRARNSLKTTDLDLVSLTTDIEIIGLHIHAGVALEAYCPGQRCRACNVHAVSTH